MYRSANNTATYGSLTIDEFCSGYLTYVMDCLYCAQPNVKRALEYLLYLNNLLDDVPLSGWEAVRDAHGEILPQIEQGRLVWDNQPARTAAINKALRRAHLENSNFKSKTPNKKAKVAGGSSPYSNKGPEKKPCPEYQTESCQFTSHHTSEGVNWRHCCATCWRVKRQPFSHPKVNCKRQQNFDAKKSKNE